MGPIFIGSPWEGQSPTRPDPTTYRHADGGDYAQLVYEINTHITSQVFLTLTIDGSNVPGTPVYLKPNGHVAAARANSSLTTNVLGLISESGQIQVNGSMTLTTSQWDAITGGSGGLNIGTWYWLSDTQEGKLVTTEPEVLGHYSVAILYALSATEALILINAPDFIVESLFAKCDQSLVLSDIVSINQVLLVSLEDSLAIQDSSNGVRNVLESASNTIILMDTATGIVYPPSFIYFEDLVNSLISKSNFDGTGIVSICTSIQNTVVKVGADATNDLVFWVDRSILPARLGRTRLGVSNYTLKYVPFSGGQEASWASGIKTVPTGFTLDPTNRWIYQYGPSGLWLQQYNADGSPAVGIGEPFAPAGTPGGIAIDLVHTFAGFSPVVYLADTGGVIRASVNYADLSSLNGNTVIYTPAGTLGQIACDDVNGYLFVMDGTLLKRMSLTGFAPITLVNIGSTVNALFVDKTQQKVYYEYGNKVVQSNYDGSGVVTVLTSTDTLNANSGYGMAP